MKTTWIAVALTTARLFAVGLGAAALAGEVPEVVCSPERYPALAVAGDPACTYPNGKPAGFRGFADPCLRRDPGDGSLWLAYSWPHMAHQGGGRTDFAVGVATHLARSTDGGQTFAKVAVLWPRTPARHRDARTGRTRDGFVSHEVPNLVPITLDGQTAWVGVRLDYFLGYPGNYRDRDNRSFVLRLAVAPTPRALADAPLFTFGHDLTSAEMHRDLNLSRLSRDFPPSFIPNEPALYYDGERLYLALVVMTFNAANQPDFGKSFVAVLATVPRGPLPTWEWRYHGKLATRTEAAELGGESLTQIELAKSRDGQLLALLTPERWDPDLAKARGGDAFHGIKHLGCAVLEVASLDPPRLARRADGALAVRGWLREAADSPLGPAAATYDPGSATGILFTLRRIAPDDMSWSLHPTRVHP